jgi:urease accessory protein UreH
VRAGRTVLLESRGTYPVQVMRPQATPSGGGLSLVLLLMSGGLLDGDDVSIEVVVETGARLALRSQAATQVHAGRSSQTMHAVVGEGAWLSYLPRALVPHADADYHGRTRVEMQADSRVLLGEALAPGRVLFGEEFRYARVRLDLDVWLAGHLVARERASIGSDPVVRAAQFGPARHTASVYQLGSGDPPAEWSAADSSLGCTRLARHGWYLRAIANRAVELDEVLDRLVGQWWSR